LPSKEVGKHKNPPPKWGFLQSAAARARKKKLKKHKKKRNTMKKKDRNNLGVNRRHLGKEVSPRKVKKGAKKTVKTATKGWTRQGEKQKQEKKRTFPGRIVAGREREWDTKERWAKMRSKGNEKKNKKKNLAKGNVNPTKKRTTQNWNRGKKTRG